MPVRPSLPNGCPDLSGTYAAPAAAWYPSDAEIVPRLSELFRLKGDGVGMFELRSPDRIWPTLSAATLVSFAQQGDALEVHLRNDAQGGATLKFHRIQFVSAEWAPDAFYDCYASEFGPALRFVGPMEEVGGWPLVYGKKETDIMTLFKGGDGSLIVNLRTDQLLVTAILLGSQAQTQRSVWWRYPLFETGR